MTFKCSCGPAISCTYPNCKEAPNWQAAIANWNVDTAAPAPEPAQRLPFVPWSKEAEMVASWTAQPERSKAPAWVPVKEKMPDMPPDAEGFPRSCVVLIYCLDGYIGSAHAAIYDEKVEWYSDDDYSHNYVTHWMPLPARPLPSGAKTQHSWGPRL